MAGYETVVGKALQVIHRILWITLASEVASSGAELPAGYVLEARLTSALASDKSRPGDPVTAELISPAVVDGTVLLPSGAKLYGTVKKAAPLGLGFKRGRASLGIDFHEIAFQERSVPVRLALATVDTAREGIGHSGDVDGISPGVSVSSALAAYAWRLVLLEPTVGAAVWAVKFLLAPAPDPEIRLPVGAEILLRVLDPVELPARGEGRPVAALERKDHREWRRFLESKPLRAERRSGAPADRINLLLAGEADWIQRAFRSAGWTHAESRNPVSLAKTYFHIVQRKGYATGPMSSMKFEGRDPDFTFQKTLNSYARRHHLRIWRAGESASGLPLWAVAATEDTNIHFSRREKNFTHEIDPNIDNERAKVVNDLVYTGCVEAASLIAMPPMETPEFVTDGAIAALRLHECGQPRMMAEASQQKRGHAFSRTVKALGKDLVRSNFGQIAITGARVPPQAFTSKPVSENHREAWARQQAALWERRAEE